MSCSKFYKFIFHSLLIVLLPLNSCQHSKENKATLSPPVKVKVLDVAETETGDERIYTGTVSSRETTTVSFSAAGTITELYVREGDRIQKGQLLGRLRSGEYQNAYNIAQAQLAEAQDGYERLKKLHDADALPDVKWVEIQQKLKQATNAAEMAERSLKDTELHSPVAGTVSNKFADIGQTVMPIEPIYEIISTTDLTIDISVSETEISFFKPGDAAIILLDTMEMRGNVVQKTVSADPLTRTYTVKIQLPKQDGTILPGMIGKVKILNNNDRDLANMGIELPSQAVLLNDDNRWFVWVLVDSVAQRRFVKPGEITSSGVIIKEGLQKGDQVIVEGIMKVGTGSRVTPLYQ